MTQVCAISLADRVAEVRSTASTVEGLLAELDAGEAAIQQARATLVAELVRAGWSWSMVGDALGVSRQAARQRYGKAGGQS